jgi:hypothetical protein
MIAALIHLCVVLLILLVVWWIVKIVATHFGLPAVAIQVVGAIFALIFLLYVLSLFGIVVPRGP